MKDTWATRITKCRPCSPGSLSFFHLIERLVEGRCNREPIHRFCTLMRKMRAASYVSETLKPNHELIEELDMAKRRTQRNVKLKATRLTVFCSHPDKGDWSDSGALPEAHILGYAVIVTLTIPRIEKRTYLLEAVCRPPSIVFVDTDSPEDNLILPVTNNYVNSKRPFTTAVGTKTNHRSFTFTGSFFTQQNGLTHVCAHAALRTAVNNSPDFGDNRLTNQRINSILGIDFQAPHKCVGCFKTDPPGVKEGLLVNEIGKVAEELQGSVHVADFTVNSSIDYDQYIYPVVESGYPVILGLEGWDTQHAKPVAHAVAVLGHTLNSDRWSPLAKKAYGSFPLEHFIPVTSWCDHFIVSDDNYGLFGALPSDMIRSHIVPAKDPNLHAMFAVTLLPKGVTILGYAAEQIAMRYAISIIKSLPEQYISEWFKVLKERKASVVSRTLLCSSKDYRQSLQNYFSQKNLKMPVHQVKKLRKLPRYVWISEISVPNIYDGNKHKLGNIVIRANAKQADHLSGASISHAWFPGIICWNDSGQMEHWLIDEHIPFLRREEPSILEW